MLELMSICDSGVKQKATSPSVWDDIFTANEQVTPEDIYNLMKEEKGPVWTAIEQKIVHHFGKIDGLKVIEIGAGMGTYSALMARKGANVTILDLSEKALAKSKRFIDALGLKAHFIRGDGLSLPESLHGAYDVSMSFGLTEHFRDKKRLMINKSHFDVLAPHGVSCIGVPNAFCLPYRFWKKKREILGKWQFGEEYPYSRRELKQLCHKLGIMQYSIIGTPFLRSLDFIFPFRSWVQSIRKRLFPASQFDTGEITAPRTTFLDAYLGYLLILIAENNAACKELKEC